jgi:hypothetical protein
MLVSIYSQPVYTDGSRGEKVFEYSYFQYDTAHFYEKRWHEWIYQEPQFYSNPYYGGWRSRFADDVYYWEWEGTELLNEYSDYQGEGVSQITFDDNGSWEYVGYNSYNLSTTTPPSGWRHQYTTVYCHYSDYTQVLYNHMYRDYQSSYQLVFVPGQGHHYIITFASGATYQTPSF